MKVVITSATEMEIVQIKRSLSNLYTKPELHLHVSFHESGVGVLPSCFSIAKMLFTQKPDLVIQAGIAGVFDDDFTLGHVVAVKEEYLGDSGAEEHGAFHDLFDLNLLQPDAFPFRDRRLTNPYLHKWNLLALNTVSGITVSEATTNSARINQLKHKYNAQTESMEGACLHYCCLQTSVPFIQIRALSNYVGDRKKANWKFRESFSNLSSCILGYIEELNEQLQAENTFA